MSNNTPKAAVIQFTALWNNSGAHDKVYHIIVMRANDALCTDDRVYHVWALWGRRGSTLSKTVIGRFNGSFNATYEANNKADEKIRDSGYRRVDDPSQVPALQLAAVERDLNRYLGAALSRVLEGQLVPVSAQCPTGWPPVSVPVDDASVEGKPCVYCRQPQPDREEYRLHLQRVHEIRSSYEVNRLFPETRAAASNPRACSRCGMSLLMFGDLRDHLMQAHGRSEADAIAEALDKFPSDEVRATLDGSPLVQCRHCVRKSTTFDSYQVHLVMAHGYTEEDADNTARAVFPLVQATPEPAETKATGKTQSYTSAWAGIRGEGRDPQVCRISSMRTTQPDLPVYGQVHIISLYLPGRSSKEAMYHTVIGSADAGFSDLSFKVAGQNVPRESTGSERAAQRIHTALLASKTRQGWTTWPTLGGTFDASSVHQQVNEYLTELYDCVVQQLIAPSKENDWQGWPLPGSAPSRPIAKRPSRTTRGPRDLDTVHIPDTYRGKKERTL